MYLKKEKSMSLVALFLVLALMQLGTIRRKDDPMVKAQADPILFKEKMEQEKDGKKEAPMPSFTLYGKQRFLSDSPVGTAPRDVAAETDELNNDEADFAAVAEDLIPEASVSAQPASQTGENDPEKSPETSSADETSKEGEDWWSEEAPPQ